MELTPHYKVVFCTFCVLSVEAGVLPWLDSLPVLRVVGLVCHNATPTPHVPFAFTRYRGKVECQSRQAVTPHACRLARWQCLQNVPCHGQQVLVYFTCH